MRRIGLFAVDSSRSRAYLLALINHDLLPAHAVYLTGGPGAQPPSFPAVPYFDNSIPVLRTIQELAIPCEVVDTDDVNSPEVVEAVRKSPVDVFIYSGPGGAILRRDILQSGKRFLHVHPGLVPRFRGSTTVYYSLLVDGECGASATFLEKQIDVGPVLATRVYPPPADRTTIDYGYDPYIRSDLLVLVLKDYQKTDEFHMEPQSGQSEENYYIMHSVLRHVAILSKRGSEAGTG